MWRFSVAPVRRWKHFVCAWPTSLDFLAATLTGRIVSTHSNRACFTKETLRRSDRATQPLKVSKATAVALEQRASRHLCLVKAISIHRRNTSGALEMAESHELPGGSPPHSSVVTRHL